MSATKTVFDRPDAWPALPLSAWADTYATLHMWTQIVGKVRLALCPLVNHWWEVPLYVSARGLTTSPIPYAKGIFEVEFNFVSHSLDIDVKIWTMPVEVPNPIRFEQDRTHASYDPQYANAFWRILVIVDSVFKEFRAGFIGKVSPVHFFWGSFDLAVTRFSGRSAPERPGADVITREAYSHEVSSVGFWPGGGDIKEAAFYSYAAPTPTGFGARAVRPAKAFYNGQMGEFLLMYDDVRMSESPRNDLLEFCQSTYEAAADLGNWDRPKLERPA
jgi:hypothetical protein